MARLVAVCKNDDCKISRRQLPITVDDDLKMVIQFNDSCVDCENEALKGVKQKGLEHFVQRFSSLSKDEVAVELMVSSKNIMNLLTHLVPCVGCRRSVEKMFNQLVETQYPVLEPLVVTRRGELSINRNYLFDPKALFALFHIHRAKLNTLMESIPKSKKNKRCNLHSLDTHKSRSTGSWFEIWDLLAPKCKQEVVLVDAHSLQVTLDTYLRKHRFCAECKSKVQCAYRILIGEKTENQEGYCAALYEGLRCCAQEKHIHMRCETNFIANLIDRAEPELSGGSRRDRHAKTLDIAQEEVLTCLGIYIHDRLHRIWQKLKAEEQTWQILFYIGVDALEKSFEVALERKQGVSNLELICEELLEEERVKEQKREQKRQKKKKKKAKSNSLLHEDEQEKENENSSRCECDNRESACIPFKHRSSCEEKCILGDENSNTSLVSHESCRGPGVGGGGTDRPLRSGSQNSDCGYLSDMETCDSCENCSAPSSNGSDVACSDGACSGHEGSDSMCGSITDALDVCTKCLSDTSHKQGNGHGYLLNKLDEDPCSCASCSSENSHQNHMPLSLLDMLEAPCNTEEDDFISEEEINQFKANQDLVSQKRQELRENLRKQFNNFQKSKGCDHPKCPSSVCKELGAAMKSCRM